MSELEDILNYLETTSLEPHDDYVSEFSYKDQKTLWKYIKELQQENQELKKQLEEYKEAMSCQKRLSEKYEKDATDYGKKLDNLRKIIKDSGRLFEYEKNKVAEQQQEFIEWLENLIGQNETVIEVSKYGLPKECSKLLIDFYKSILSKYKEIVGGSNENRRN